MRSDIEEPKWAIQPNHNSSVAARSLLPRPGRRCALTSGSAEAKIAQTGVRYQDLPKDGKQCDGCKLFIAPNACKTVDGAIAPQGWCALWVKKG